MDSGSTTETLTGRMLARFDNLTSRTIIVVLIGIGIFHVVSLWTYQQALVAEATVASEVRLADRLVAIKRSVMRAPVAEREAVAHDFSGGAIEAHWSREEHATAGGPGAESWEGLGRRIRTLAPELGDGEIVIGANRAVPDDPHLGLISMRLPDGSWVNVGLVASSPNVAAGHGTLLSTSLMALGAVLVSVLLVRWLTRPLSTFAESARRFYRSEAMTLVPERGPSEIRSLAAAFNDMQRRIAGLIADRTQALAAVSHDLKTPISRLRFRAEAIEDQVVRTSIAADLSEMERMIDQTLAYLRGDREDEAVRPVDLVAILETLCDDLSDAGGEAALIGPPHAIVDGRRLALKRAFANLLHNAVKYGERAKVEVGATDDDIFVTITDDGPGIPPEAMERALAPYVRLEPSRNPETGGFGLGLPIALAIIKGHHGELSLTNGVERGLVATVRLPRRSSPHFGNTPQQ